MNNGDFIRDDHPLLMDRSVRLSNGDTIPLDLAVGALGQLQLLNPPGVTDGNFLYHLRQWCFGQSIPEEVRAHFQQQDLLGDDGQLLPEVRSVALSSIRGQDSSLILESPFCTELDRALADYVLSQNVLFTTLDRQLVDTKLFAKKNWHSVVDQQVLPAIQQLSSTANSPESTLSPEQSRSILHRVRERLKQERGTSPPPPN